MTANGLSLYGLAQGGARFTSIIKLEPRAKVPERRNRIANSTPNSTKFSELCARSSANRSWEADWLAHREVQTRVVQIAMLGFPLAGVRYHNRGNGAQPLDDLSCVVAPICTAWMAVCIYASLAQALARCALATALSSPSSNEAAE